MSSITRLICSPVLGVACLFAAAALARAQAPIEPVAAAPSALDNPADRAIAALLAAGIPSTGRSDLSAAKAHYAEALKHAPGSSDAHLAYALVQLHNQQNAAGQKTLDSLVSGDGPVVPAAHQIQILLLLSKKNFTQGTSAALTYAGRIADASPERFPDEQKEIAARWLGRLMGFYLHPGESQKAADVLRKRRGEIETFLSRELAAAFNAGIQSVQKDFADLQSGVGREVESLHEDANREEAAALEKVFAGQEQATSEKGKLKETGEKLESLRKERLDYVKQQLAPLMRQNQELYQMRAFIDQQRKSQLLGASIGKSKDRVAEEMMMCEAQIMQLQPKIKGWINAGMQVEAMYYQAKGQVAQKNADLAKFEEQLGATKTNIQEQKDDRTQVRAGKRKQDSLRELATYLPLDYRAERDRLLARLGEK